MKFIKVEDTTGVNILINLYKISHIYYLERPNTYVIVMNINDKIKLKPEQYHKVLSGLVSIKEER